MKSIISKLITISIIMLIFTSCGKLSSKATQNDNSDLINEAENNSSVNTYENDASSTEKPVTTSVITTKTVEETTALNTTTAVTTTVSDENNVEETEISYPNIDLTPTIPPEIDKNSENAKQILNSVKFIKRNHIYNINEPYVKMNINTPLYTFKVTNIHKLTTQERQQGIYKDSKYPNIYLINFEVYTDNCNIMPDSFVFRFAGNDNLLLSGFEIPNTRSKKEYIKKNTTYKGEIVCWTNSYVNGNNMYMSEKNSKYTGFPVVFTFQISFDY